MMMHTLTLHAIHSLCPRTTSSLPLGPSHSLLDQQPTTLRAVVRRLAPVQVRDVLTAAAGAATVRRSSFSWSHLIRSLLDRSHTASVTLLDLTNAIRKTDEHVCAVSRLVAFSRRMSCRSSLHARVSLTLNCLEEYLVLRLDLLLTFRTLALWQCGITRLTAGDVTTRLIEIRR
jgi:hypothetical protein